MPARRGATSITIAVPDNLAALITTMASAVEYEGSKSKFIETCIRAFVDDAGHMTALDTVHQHIASGAADMTKALQDVGQTMSTLSGELTQLRAEVATLRSTVAQLTTQHDTRWGEMVQAFDRLSGRTPAARPRRWRLW